MITLTQGLGTQADHANVRPGRRRASSSISTAHAHQDSSTETLVQPTSPQKRTCNHPPARPGCAASSIPGAACQCAAPLPLPTPGPTAASEGWLPTEHAVGCMTTEAMVGAAGGSAGGVRVRMACTLECLAASPGKDVGHSGLRRIKKAADALKNFMPNLDCRGMRTED
jgi:hypothetical protein